MSLVNDMLRDLDQRRKEAEGPAARIRSTPAGDYPRRERKNWAPFVAVGLVIVAAGLAWVWIDMSQTQTSQRLATTVTPATVVETDDEEVTQEAVIARVNVEVVAAEPGIESTSSPILSEDVAPTQSDALASSSSPSANTTSVSIAEAANAALADSGLSLAPTSVAATPLTATPLTATPLTTTPLAANPDSRLSPASVRNREPTNSAPEQIKDVSAPSPERRDTMVVQEALRMLANNQTAEAYSTLEQHLLDSPYAHQSRETYAKFLMNQGDIVAAEELTDIGLNLAPNHSGFKKVKARLLIEANDIQSAVSLLESRAPAVAADLEYHEILASAQLASRDYDGAVLSYTGLVQQDQTQGRWWYGFAAAQDALGNLTAASQAYTRALEKPNLSTNLRRRSQDRLTVLSR